MQENSRNKQESRQKLVLYSFHLSWMTFIVVFALFMRLIIKPENIGEELEALDLAETAQISPEISLPPTLESVTRPLPVNTTSQLLYVPLYQNFYVGNDRALEKLVATLSLHNTSSSAPLILKSLKYFNAQGKEVRSLLEKPYLLPPLASAEFYIDHQKPADAPIASAVVDWSGNTSITPPLVEAVIIGKYGNKSFSVISKGVISQ